MYKISTLVKHTKLYYLLFLLKTLRSTCDKIGEFCTFSAVIVAFSATGGIFAKPKTELELEPDANARIQSSNSAGPASPVIHGNRGPAR